MSELTKFYEVWVWVKGFEENREKVIIETRPPLTPMDVKDQACKRGFFSWSEYTSLKYKRVSRREERK